MTHNVLKHLSLLGKRARDRVTQMEGIIVSVTFDLYGCVQAVMNPGVGPDGRTREMHWLDVNRLEITCDVPVMKPPEFTLDTPEARGEHGPSERPVHSFPVPHPA